MTSTHDTWQKMKSVYLEQIQSTLQDIPTATLRQILSDVEEHLDMRCSELEPSQQTNIAFEQIISDMGSPQEYAELLLADYPEHITKRRLPIALLIGAVIVIVVLLGTIPFFLHTSQFKGMSSLELSHAGWQLWRTGEYKEAEMYFRQAVKKDDQNPTAWNGLGWSQYHQGQFKKAADSFETCVKLNDQFSGAWNGLGYIAQMNGDNQAAINAWEKAISVSSNAVSSLSGLADLYMQTESYDKAIDVYEKWLESFPNSDEARLGLETARKKKQGIPEN